MKKRNKFPKGKSKYKKYEPNNHNEFVTYNFSELKRIITNEKKSLAITKVKHTLVSKNQEINYLKNIISSYQNQIELIKENLYYANNPEIDRYNDFR